MWPIILLLLLPWMVAVDAQAQEELVLVASSSFTMTITPTHQELLPESFRIIQMVANEELQIAQEENEENSNNINSTILYVSNRTRIVFRDAMYDSVKMSSAVQFFALATVLAVSVPDGTSFRDYRLRTASARQKHLDDMVARVLDSTSNVSQFMDRIHIAAANAMDNTGIDDRDSTSISVASAQQLLDIESIAVDPIPISNQTSPSGTDINSISSSTKERWLTTIDVVLICVSVAIFITIVALAWKYRQDRLGSSAEQETGPSEDDDALVLMSNHAGMQHMDKKRNGDFMGSVRVATARDMGEFKTNDSASSSIASIIFADFSTSPPLRKPNNLGSYVRDMEHATAQHGRDSPRPPDANGAMDIVPQRHQQEDLPWNGAQVPSPGVSSHLSGALGGDGSRRMEGTSQSSLTTAGWSTGTENSSIPSTSTHPEEIIDEIAMISESGRTNSHPPPHLNSFTELVDTLLLSTAAVEATPPVESSNHVRSLSGSVSDPLEIGFYDDDDDDDESPAAMSAENGVFRKNGHSGSCGSTSPDVFKVDVEAASTAKSKQSDTTTISAWMKSIHVISSSSGTTDSQTSVNTSFSSVTPPSSVEHSMESSRQFLQKRKRRRRLSNPVVEEEGEYVEV